jgi:hypothetical protein
VCLPILAIFSKAIAQNRQGVNPKKLQREIRLFRSLPGGRKNKNKNSSPTTFTSALGKGEIRLWFKSGGGKNKNKKPRSKDQVKKDQRQESLSFPIFIPHHFYTSF